MNGARSASASDRGIPYRFATAWPACPVVQPSWMRCHQKPAVGVRAYHRPRS